MGWTYWGTPFAAAVATGHPAAYVGGPPWVNMASCCWVETNATLSWRISAVSAEILSFVAWEVALFDNPYFAFYSGCWLGSMLSWHRHRPTC